MADYSAKKAEEFWTNRVKGTDELAAVLSYSLPREVNEAYSEWEVGTVLRCLGSLEGKRVLDLPCGVGRVTVPLAQQGASVTAGDNSQEMLDRCRGAVERAAAGSRVSYLKLDATQLAIPDAEFDVVACLGLLEHLPDEPRAKTVRELIRVTKPGGTVVLVVNNASSAFLRSEKRYDISDQRADGYFCSVVDREAIAATLTAAGFRCTLEGSNTFQSVAKHLLRGYFPQGLGSNVLGPLFQLCTALDLSFPNKADLDTAFADQYILKATRS